ncbi:Vegetative incompatibility protein HET-E-1 [Monascus purpureus]|nr:Vegetative incompatibility protein HET-E-1 [Monascus purpureus]
MYLEKLVTAADAQEKKLDNIHLVIQDQTRQQEQRHQDNKDKQGLKNLRVTDPREDKKRIQETKGGLLEDCYHWILDHANFRQFCDDPQSRLLWIKGDPGKGKTILLCGIINELGGGT